MLGRVFRGLTREIMMLLSPLPGAAADDNFSSAYGNEARISLKKQGIPSAELSTAEEGS